MRLTSWKIEAEVVKYQHIDLHLPFDQLRAKLPKRHFSGKSTARCLSVLVRVTELRETEKDNYTNERNSNMKKRVHESGSQKRKQGRRNDEVWAQQNKLCTSGGVSVIRRDTPYTHKKRSHINHLNTRNDTYQHHPSLPSRYSSTAIVQHIVKEFAHDCWNFIYIFFLM